MEAALRHYEAMKRAQKAYRERKRQALKDAGIYKGPGRPRKEPTLPPQTESVAGEGV